MGFEIAISEVGEAEYPLIETLRDSIFPAYGHASRTTIAEALAHRQDLHVLIAHLEGNPLGFAAGYRRGPKLFYLNCLGVLPEYRRQGLGRQMLARQEAFARSRGSAQITFNTFNHFPEMIRLALTSGYAPTGVEQHFGTNFDLAIRFDKPLLEEAKPPSRGLLAHADPDFAETRVPADDAGQLLRALDNKMAICGIVHEAGVARPMVLLRKSDASPA